MKCEKYTACKAEIFQEHCQACEATTKNKQLQAELEQEKSYSSDLKKQLAGTRGIVDKQAEEIERLKDDLQVCMKAGNIQAKQLSDQDEVIEILKG